MASAGLETDDSWTVYAVSRVIDMLLQPWQAQPPGGEIRDEWSARLAYRDFRAGIGATFPQASGFHPFLHEIVTVEQAEDPDEEPSVVAQWWPGSLIGSLMLVRAGVTVRAGAHHLDARMATTSPLLWVWRRRHRPAMDLSHGRGHNSQWRTAFAATTYCPTGWCTTPLAVPISRHVVAHHLDARLILVDAADGLGSIVVTQTRTRV
jgi:hypothetical protein